MKLHIVSGSASEDRELTIRFAKSYNQAVLDAILDSDIEFTAPADMYVAPDAGDTAGITSLKGSIAKSAAVTEATMVIDDSTYKKVDEHTATIEAVFTAGTLKRRIVKEMTIGSD